MTEQKYYRIEASFIDGTYLSNFKIYKNKDCEIRMLSSLESAESKLDFILNNDITLIGKGTSCCVINWKHVKAIWIEEED